MKQLAPQRGESEVSVESASRADMVDGPPFVVRDITEHDAAFVTSSWKQSYRHGAPHVKWVPAYQYFQYINDAVDGLLSRSSCKLAVHESHHDSIIGWVCFNKKAIHYVYVKQDYRQMGIGSALLKSTGLMGKPSVPITHWTEVVEKILEKEPHHQFFYAPSLISA